jgi:Holliday junction resolvase RusA-like endonuclease
METKEWFISGNTPSLKNSKIKTSRGIFPSKTVMNYLRNKGIKSYSASKKKIESYKTRENEFLKELEDFPEFLAKDYPIKLGLHFVRDSKRQADYGNCCQLILDLLTAGNFIEDDSMDYVFPYPYERDGKLVTIDKENPGVYIKIINNG